MKENVMSETENNHSKPPSDTSNTFSLYHIEILSYVDASKEKEVDGIVFSGTLEKFEKSFFTFPTHLLDEEKLKVIEVWANDQGWTLKRFYLH
jgi:hypothetical protein